MGRITDRLVFDGERVHVQGRLMPGFRHQQLTVNIGPRTYKIVTAYVWSMRIPKYLDTISPILLEFLWKEIGKVSVTQDYRIELQAGKLDHKEISLIGVLDGLHNPDVAKEFRQYCDQLGEKFREQCHIVIKKRAAHYPGVTTRK